MITETIVTTRTADDLTHIAPMGLRKRGDLFLLAPFKPSRSLDNMHREGSAIINYTDDVRVFAGCLTGRCDWPLCPADKVRGRRLRSCLSHMELMLEDVKDDELRPELLFRSVHKASHAPFQGFNRAQAAVLEAAVLTSRLHMLPREKIAAEIDYLAIAVEKTAGPRERIAWSWLMQRVAAFHAGQPEEHLA